jgi:flavin reductase (DIM6/NTAB) family NADH-FMN oxidoreductase RutF
MSPPAAVTDVDIAGDAAAVDAGIDAGAFRTLFAELAASPTIVAALDRSGNPCGATCTAVIPISATPPLLLVSLDLRSDTLTDIRHRRSFSVNILGRGAEDIAARFATKVPDKFAGLAWQRSPVHGNPLLPEHSSAYADCRVEEWIPAGDHVMLLARIRHSGVGSAPEPVVYHRRAFRGVAPHAASARAGGERA